MKYISLVLIILVLSACSTGKMTQKDQEKVLKFGEIVFAGGDGSDEAHAIIILNAPNVKKGVEAEYFYISKKFGKRGDDWILLRRGMKEENGKHYAILEFAVDNTSTTTVLYFDITGFHDKY